MKTLMLVAGLALCGTTCLQAQTLATLNRPDALKNPPLFFALTPEQAAKAGSSLEIRIALNGKPYLHEELTLGGKTGLDRLAFELLAARPDLREGLFELGRDRSLRITATALLDGAPIREFTSFGELLRYSRQLRLGSFQPTRAVSRVRHFLTESSHSQPDFTKGWQLDPVCTAACQDAYYSCVANNCSGNKEMDCPWCESQYVNCHNSCPSVCVDPMQVTEETRTELDFVTGAGSGCFMKYSWYNEIYAHFTEYYTHTRVRITEYCNGSRTEEVLSTWGSTRYCSTPTGWSCSNPSGHFSGWIC